MALGLNRRSRLPTTPGLASPERLLLFLAGANGEPSRRRENTERRQTRCAGRLALGMRLLTWNLNHRAARRAIPNWVPVAIGDQQPDLAVLTEYVEGAGHDGFLSALADLGLSYPMASRRTARQNQVLIVSRLPIACGQLIGPAIHPAVPSNILHVVVPGLSFHLLGCRVPAFDQGASGRALKRAVWEWLIQAGQRLEAQPAAITGDLNTAIGDSAKDCGDMVLALAQSGWQHAIPDTGCSWKAPRSATERRIDHTFLSPSIAEAQARYVWDFEAMLPGGVPGVVGTPDHAMLVVDF